MGADAVVATLEETGAVASGMRVEGDAAKLFAALAKAQKGFDTVVPDSTGQVGHRAFKYADLGVLVAATRPSLVEHGFAVLQPISTDEKGRLVIGTVLAHESGAYVHASVVIDPGQTGTKEGVQWCGALTTYWRRFQYRAILGLADGEDLDEPGAPKGASVAGPSDKKPVSLDQRHKLRDLVRVMDERGIVKTDFRVPATEFEAAETIRLIEERIAQARATNGTADAAPAEGFTTADKVAPPARGKPTKVGGKGGA